MRIFVTGATGFIGSAVVRELIDAGHQVIGLTRSDQGAASLAGIGVEVCRGDLSDLDSLRGGVVRSDGVIHTGFVHDFSNFAACCETDRLAILAMGSELAGSDRPMLVTDGIGIAEAGRLRTEDDPPTPPSPMLPRVSSQTAESLRGQGVRISVVRVPQVHDRSKSGVFTYAVAAARAKGASAYIGDGSNRFAAVHVRDAARLYRLALEGGSAEARYHAVAEEGLTFREVAEAIGRGTKTPVISLPPGEAVEHFGVIGPLLGLDLAASGQWTQERLAWRPTGPGLIADLDSVGEVLAGS